VVARESEPVRRITVRYHYCQGGSSTGIERVGRVGHGVRTRRSELEDWGKLKSLWQLDESADRNVMAFVLRHGTPLIGRKQVIAIAGVVAEGGCRAATCVIAIGPG